MQSVQRPDSDSVGFSPHFLQRGRTGIFQCKRQPSGRIQALLQIFPE